jgi:hypothetical protein
LLAQIEILDEMVLREVKSIIPPSEACRQVVSCTELAAFPAIFTGGWGAYATLYRNVQSISMSSSATRAVQVYYLVVGRRLESRVQKTGLIFTVLNSLLRSATACDSE